MTPRSPVNKVQTGRSWAFRVPDAVRSRLVVAGVSGRRHPRVRTMTAERRENKFQIKTPPISSGSRLLHRARVGAIGPSAPVRPARPPEISATISRQILGEGVAGVLMSWVLGETRTAEFLLQRVVRSLRDEQSVHRDGIEAPVYELRFVRSCVRLPRPRPLRPAVSPSHPCWLGGELDPLPSFPPHLGEIVVEIELEDRPDTRCLVSNLVGSLAKGPKNETRYL